MNNTMSNLNIQQTVCLIFNKILPKDINHDILSFVFYDKVTGEARKVHHNIMREIVFRFENGYYISF